MATNNLNIIRVVSCAALVMLTGCALSGCMTDLQRLQQAHDAGFYGPDPSDPIFVKEYTYWRQYYHDLYRRPSLLYPYLQ